MIELEEYLNAFLKIADHPLMRGSYGTVILLVLAWYRRPLIRFVHGFIKLLNETIKNK